MLSGPVTAVCTYKTLGELYVQLSLDGLVHFHQNLGNRHFGHHFTQESSCPTQSSSFRTYTRRKMTDGTIARKPKRSPLAKQFRKWNNYFAGMALPFARYAPKLQVNPYLMWLINFLFALRYSRYAILPALGFYALYYTEPEPTLMDLVNPFF